MMVFTPEQPHFNNQEKKAETPKEKNEQLGLKLAQEVAALRAKSQKTKEDYETILRKLQEIKTLFSPEAREEFKPAEIFNFLLNLRKNTGLNITDAGDVHFQPDGTLAGEVETPQLAGVHSKATNLLKRLEVKRL